MKKETKEDIKILSSAGMLVVGTGFGVAGFCVSPVGVIDETVLMLIAQCFLFAATGLGMDAFVKIALRKYMGENYVVVKKEEEEKR